MENPPNVFLSFKDSTMLEFSERTRFQINRSKLSTLKMPVFGLTLLTEQVIIAVAIFQPSLFSSVSQSTTSAELESFMFLLSKEKSMERLCSVLESTESSELNI
jgi:hypothetical protein